MKLITKRLLAIGIILCGGLSIGLVTLLPNYTQTQLYLFAAVGGLIALLGFVYAFLGIRCPYCGKYLDLRLSFETYCPYCGEHLD